MNDAEIGHRLMVAEVQLATAIGLLVCLVEVLPEEKRAEALQKMDRAIETAHASLLAEGGPHSEAAIQGVENIRAAIFG